MVSLYANVLKKRNMRYWNSMNKRIVKQWKDDIIVIIIDQLFIKWDQFMFYFYFQLI